MTQQVSTNYSLGPIQRTGQRKPSLADWGIPMTVCIAAVSRKNNRIVTASDFMLSTELVSADTRTVKAQPIGSSGRWLSMFSGYPSVESIMLTLVRGNLAHSTSETSEEIITAMEQAFREALKRKIEGELLSPYGIDRATFLRHGKEWFGDEEFLRILYHVNATRLETSFLVAGFEPNKTPRILSIVDPGVSERHESLGFHAIGTGELRALGSLYTTYDYDEDVTTDELIYRVCEAKFLSESASGVGKRTIVDVIAPDGTHEGLYPVFVEMIRAIWKQKGRSPMPEDALQTIQSRRHEIKWDPTLPPLSS